MDELRAPPRWNGPSAGARWAAALLALGITGMLGGFLIRPPPEKVVPQMAAPVAYLVRVPDSDSGTLRPVESGRPLRTGSGVRREVVPDRSRVAMPARATEPGSPEHPPQPTESTAVGAMLGAAVAEEPSLPASQPKLHRGALDVSPAAVNRAIAQSRSGFRSMAEASGTYTGDPPVSPAERLSRDTQRAAKEDCLRQGGSLLSPLLILYEMATDKCTVR